MFNHALQLTVQSVIAIGVVCAILLSSAPAAVPDKIKQRFVLLENYAKQPRVGLDGAPGGGVKAWTKDERTIFWYYIDMIYERAPALIERAVQYRPVRVYRVKDPKFQRLIAQTYTQELFLADWWFYPYTDKKGLERDILVAQPLTHEMFHLAEPFSSVSYSKEWQGAVAPRMQKVRDHFKEQGMGIYEARKNSKTPDEHDAIAHAQGLPNLWSAYATYEALAEIGATMIVQKHIEIAPEMQKILKTNFFKRPGKKDPAKSLAHQAHSAWEKGEIKKAIELFTKAENAGANWGNFYSHRAKLWNANLFALKEAPVNVIVDLSKAIDIMIYDGPNDLLTRAFLWASMGERKLAIKDYSDYLKVGVFENSPLEKRADVYQKAGNYDSALDDLNLLIERTPKSAKISEYFLNRSQVRFLLKQTDRALEDADKAISLNKNNPYRHYFLRGLIWRQKPDVEKAIADFSKSIELNPKFGGAYYNRGLAHRKKGQADLAIADYTKAIESNPKYTDAYYNRGTTYRYKGRYDLAIADYTKVLELNPKYANAYNNRGFAYGKKGQVDLAIGDYTKAIEFSGKDVFAYNQRGLAYHKKRKFDLAIADYTKSIEFYPQYADAYNNRGLAYRRTDQVDLAIADYTKAIEFKSKYAYAYVNRGLAYGKKRQFDLAIADYSKAIEFSPKYTYAYNQRGLSYRKNGQLNLAIADHTKAIELKPKYTYAYNNRGLAHYNKGELDVAIDDYTKAIGFNPKFAEAHNNRGRAHYKKNQFDLAIADYTKAIELKPKYAYAFNIRGVAYMKKNQFDLAIADHTRAIELSPKFSDAYNGRAWTYYKSGKAAQGLPDANRALRLLPDDANFLGTRAHIYETLGEQDAAIADYRNSLRLEPSLQSSKDGLKRLGAEE